MASRLAIVPARGGSKRIPHKNIRAFCGRPIISYVLEVARKSGLFADIHVSTDSEKISDIVTNLGFPPHFMRPSELGDDQTPLMTVLRYVVQAFAAAGRRYDEVWLLMACAPLLEAADLAGAARLFSEAGSRVPVLSVAPYPSPIEWAFRQDSQGQLAAVQPQMLSRRSQDIDPSFYDAGSFCVFPAEMLFMDLGTHSANYLGYELPRYKAIDIDNEEDFLFAETVFSALSHRARCDALKPLDLSCVRAPTLDAAPGIVIRPLLVEDVTIDYVDALNDVAVNRFLVSATGGRYTLENVSATVRENFESADAMLFGIFRDGRHCGNVRLHDIKGGAAYMGIAIFGSDQARGIGRLALRVVAEFARSGLGIQLIRAGIDRRNVASAKAFASVGFRVSHDSSDNHGQIWTLDTLALRGDAMGRLTSP